MKAKINQNLSVKIIAKTMNNNQKVGPQYFSRKFSIVLFYNPILNPVKINPQRASRVNTDRSRIECSNRSPCGLPKPDQGRFFSMANGTMV